MGKDVRSQADVPTMCRKPRLGGGGRRVGGADGGNAAKDVLMTLRPIHRSIRALFFSFFSIVSQHDC